MTLSIQEQLIKSLPIAMRQGAVDLSAEGVREYAFPIMIAEQVFDKLNENKFQILGGDLWRRDSEEFVFWNAGWSTASSGAEEEWRSFYLKVRGLESAYVTFVVKR